MDNLILNFRRTGGRASGLTLQVRCRAVKQAEGGIPAPAGYKPFDWRAANEDEAKLAPKEG